MNYITGESVEFFDTVKRSKRVNGTIQAMNTVDRMIFVYWSVQPDIGFSEYVSVDSVEFVERYDDSKSIGRM